MKAFVVKAPKEYSVELIDIPEPVDNEILVKLETSGICHTDLHIANFDWPRQPNYPMIPGHEGIGIVTKVGPNCTKIKVGDRVGVAYVSHLVAKTLSFWRLYFFYKKNIIY
ncbi:alcohol dehydrogenase catalytic domain-containing protein, partial [Mycoplasmopsis bovis]|uniref:alcohol dehydrogenase catalytic domain-containing protein n=1 Tax=Mycoplasmopsis bovis TaxID=28903 RepID=UPI003F7971D1